MPTVPKLRKKLTYSNVVSTLCLFLLLGGGAAYAASQLAKNSVGSKQLKKNAVTTAKIKNQAITGAKIKNGTLTGTQINASTLGTVPAAQTAQTANSIAAPEGYHEVTELLNGWSNVKLSLGAFPESVAFYKDQEGVVHLRGEAISGAGGSVIFKLPPGDRPASGRFIREPVSCGGAGCPNGVGAIAIAGSNFKIPADEGGVIAPVEATDVFLDGVTFRAAS
jgi:hypothetical protein